MPLAIDLDRCIQAKWCHTGCIYGAKNSVITNYLASAEQMGVQVRPNSQAELITPERGPAVPLPRDVSEIDNDGDDPTRQPTGREFQIECKVLILSAGAMGNSPLLMRSRPALPSLSAQAGKHLGINGDHIAAVEYDEQKVRDVLGLPGYGQIYKGNHISTMTYDFWADKPGNAGDGKRFTLQEIYLSPLAHTLYDDGRDPTGGAVVLRAAEEAGAVHLQQPHRDARDGRGHARRRVPRAAAVRQPRAPERRAARRGAVHLRAVGAVGAGARGRRRRDPRASWSAAAWAGS